MKGFASAVVLLSILLVACSSRVPERSLLTSSEHGPASDVPSTNDTNSSSYSSTRLPMYYKRHNPRPGGDGEDAPDLRAASLAGLQIMHSWVCVPRLHGAVWGTGHELVGVGALEPAVDGQPPRLLEAAQALWLTNRPLPPAPGPRDAVAPVRLRDARGRPHVVLLPVMPQVALRALPRAPAYMFQHVAWLFSPDSDQPAQQKTVYLL